MKLLFFYLIVLTYSCSTEEKLRFDTSKIKELQITSRLDSGLNLLVNNHEIINYFFDDCINQAKAEPVKFIMNYQIKIVQEDRSDILIINGNALNLNGKTFRSKCNVDDKIRNLVN